MSDRDLHLQCPAPRAPRFIELSHGAGARRTRKLLEEVFFPAFDDPPLATHHDAAVLGDLDRLAFTTDSYVVKPLFFPGGDIGKLAVCGTVNDLAAAGARPLFLSAAFILEEGLPLDVLERVVASMREAAREARVRIVTGDTKVVDRGKGDGIFICTSGIGAVPAGVDIGPRRVRAGDAVIVSGDLGRHGAAILSVREGLAFEAPLVSDCASLGDLVGTLLASSADVHCIRDLTRGGLAAALTEIAEDASVGILLEEAAIPVSQVVAGACELLGLDPMLLANEGRMVFFVPEHDASRALEALRGHPLGADAVRVGRVTSACEGTVAMRTRIGGTRVVDLLAGEQLPRIC